ncbi:MAG: hypothetical protein Q6367_016740 [Candidatus Freyarchaeota archaeon]
MFDSEPEKDNLICILPQLLGVSLGLSTTTKLKVIAYVIIGLASIVLAFIKIFEMRNPPFSFQLDWLTVAMVVVLILMGATFFYNSVQFMRKEERTNNRS